MKFLIPLLFCFSAFASTTGMNVKVSDGGVANCKSRADEYKLKFGAYKTTIKKISSDNENLNLSIIVSFLSCKSNEGVYAFEKSFPYDKFTYLTMGLNKELKNVSVQAQEIKLITFKDGVYKKLSEVLFENSKDQTVEIQIKLSDVLNEKELTSLLAGQTVAGSFDYQLQKILVISSQNYVEQINFGAFRVHFKAKLDKNHELLISLL